MTDQPAEHDVESIRRLVHAVWLIGQGMLVEDGDDQTGAAIKQLAEEIEDKLASLLRPQAAAR
jgi:energy-coupling factor transporter ATP-binding protein EcfA2